jgi:hypothetical protein
MEYILRESHLRRPKQIVLKNDLLDSPCFMFFIDT